MTHSFASFGNGDEIYLSEWIIDEVAGKLREKFEMPEAKLEESINFIKGGAKVINPDGEPPSVCRDKVDNNVLHVVSCIEAYSIRMSG